METEAAEEWTSDLAVAELRYILCREIDWQESCDRVNKLLASGIFEVEDTLTLINEASRMKWERTISLADRFTLPLAGHVGGVAVFARKEHLSK